MHLRKAGKLRYQKRGNVFLYAGKDVRREALLREKTANDLTLRPAVGECASGVEAERGV